jgi:hypothetical protein
MSRLCLLAVGSGLPYLGGYPFEVRYSDGALVLAKAAADIAADAYAYFSRLFSAVRPDIALIVVNETDWSSRQPYGLAFFNDDDGEIRPGVVVMPAGGGEFWIAIAQDLRDASEICGSPRFGSARSSSTWPCTPSSQPSYRRACRHSRRSQPWEREVESLPLGYAPRATARSRSCKPITRVVMKRIASTPARPQRRRWRRF